MMPAYEAKILSNQQLRLMEARSNLFVEMFLEDGILEAIDRGEFEIEVQVGDGYSWTYIEDALMEKGYTVTGTVRRKKRIMKISW